MKKNLFKIFAITFLTASVLFETSCKKENLNEDLLVDGVSGYKVATKNWDASVPKSWYSLENRLIKETPNWAPPIAARAFGYIGVTLYESVRPGMSTHPTLVGQLTDFNFVPSIMPNKAYNWPIVANAAIARITKDLFGNASVANVNRIDSLESANLSAIQIADNPSTQLINRSVSYGQSVADAIYSWSLTDGGHQAYLNLFPAYTIPSGPGLWQPTPPAFSNPLLPYWGNNRPFVTANTVTGMPVAPFPYSTQVGDTFYNAALEVYNTVNNLTPDQQNIALYWADGGGTFTPPGHMMSIVSQIITDKNLSLDKAAILYAKAGISLADAGVCCWKGKYDFNVLRPITYIRANFNASWNSLITTPPFPSYCSGHSTFSGAVMQMLTYQYGSNTSFTDYSKVASGFSARSFSNFLAAANEAAVSRLYGGIHYSFDNERGLIAGQAIGQNIHNLNW